MLHKLLGGLAAACHVITVARPVLVGPTRIGDGPVREDYSHGPMATLFAPLPTTIHPGETGLLLAVLPEADPTWGLVLWEDYGALWLREEELALLDWECPHCGTLLQHPYSAAWCPQCNHGIDVDQMLPVLPA